MFITDYTSYLTTLFAAKVTPLIWSTHGVGKTQSIQDFADNGGHKVFVLCLGNMADAGDVLGLGDFQVDQYTGQKVATRFFRPNWMHELFTWAKENPTKLAIIHLDEINRAARHLQPIVLQMAINFRLHEEVFPDNVRIVASANPPTKDYDGTVDLKDKAYWDRFCHLKLTPTVDSWLSYGRKKGLNEDILNFVQEHPAHLMPSLATFSIDEYAQPSPRAMEAAARLVTLGAADELIYGVIGAKTGLMFTQWLRDNKAKTVTVDDILKYTKKTRATVAVILQQERRAEIASINNQLCTHLKELDETPVTEKQAVNIAEYAMDLPDDMMTGLLFNLVKYVSVAELIDKNEKLHKLVDSVIASGAVDLKQFQQPEKT